MTASRSSPAGALADRLDSTRELGRLSDVSVLLSGLADDGPASAHLLDVEAGIGMGGERVDPVSTVSTGDMRRFRRVLDAVRSTDVLTPDHLLRWHALAVGDRPGLHPGEFRRASTAFGGADLQGPAWELPPAHQVARRIEELTEYANLHGGHPILAATVLMGEIDAVRPFAGGNGRMARALFHWALSRQWGLVWPVSVRWAARPARVRASLDSWRTGSNPNLWLSSVVDDLLVVGRACHDLDGALVDLRARWMEHGGGRAGSLRRQLLRDLPARPVVDSADAAVRMNADPSRFSRVARQLVEEGYLTAYPLASGRVGRPAVRYQAHEPLELVRVWVERLARTGAAEVPSPGPSAGRLDEPSVGAPPASPPRGRPVPSKVRRSP